MGKWSRALLLITVSLALASSLPTARAEKVEGTAVVDIERPFERSIDFTEGDTLDLKAEISATPYPITVFLLKGEEAHDEWLSTEEVDLEKIRHGENVTGNTTFEVIINFSKKNVTAFSNEISIGSNDAYYLVVILHRDQFMSAEALLERTSSVDYVMEWTIEERSYPYYLIPVAVILFAIGAALIVYALWSLTRRELKEDERERSQERPRTRTIPPVRRGPPVGRRPPAGRD